VLLFRGWNAVLALFRQGALQFNSPPFKAQGGEQTAAARRKYVDRCKIQGKKWYNTNKLVVSILLYYASRYC